MNRSTFTAVTGAMAAILAGKPLLANAASARQRIAMVIYPDMTSIDLIAPQLLFALLGNVDVHLVWKDRATVVTDTGVPIAPTQRFDEVESEPWVLFVPGGTGAYPMMNDPKVVGFLQRVGPTAQYLTSVCTGSLILGAAGLLRGYRATTYWMMRDLLTTLGATPVAERVVVDRNRITGAGVTAGLDFGLTMAAMLRGDDYARMLQLAIEYDPKPPFDSGNETKAGAETVRSVRSNFATSLNAATREAAIARSRLGIAL